MAADLRHEFHDGEVFAMAGSTFNHSVIATNLLGLLQQHSRQQGCVTFNGDLRIRIESENCFLYPEASLTCDEPIMSEEDPHALINPGFIAEVLSEGTEGYDRGRKFFLYQQVASFREYWLLDQHRPFVSTFFKNQAGVWEFQNVFGLEANAPIRSLGVTLPLQELYRNARNLP